MSLRLRAFSDFLARYTRVWRQVWSVRHEMDPPKRDPEERAFLPAQLELTETPVSAAPKWTARLIVLFAALALIWAVVGKLDIVAVAQGKTTLGGHSKTIQPLETAVVDTLLVKDGDHVKKDQVLVTLKAVGSDADVAQAQKTLQAARLSHLRNQALLQALDSQSPPRLNKEEARTWNLEEADLAQAQTLAVNQYQSWSAQDNQLQSVLQQHQAELASARYQVQKLQSVGAIEARKTADYQKLVQEHFISEHAFVDQQSKSLSNAQDLNSQRSQIQQINAQIAQARQNRVLNTQNLRRDTLDALRQANEQMAQSAAQNDKAQQRQALMTLKSPVDGVVQQQAAFTLGGVVTAAQPILVVVPDEDKMTVEALVENKDIGFVRAGQDVVVKVESFPYTRYGYLTGKVKSVSADAIKDDKLGLVYAAIITLDRNWLEVEGKRIALSAGMNVTAEIKTGKRRVIDYLLSPLRTKVDDSLRER